jgi:hypothetical protein
VPAIFEAAFEHQSVFVRVDMLHRRRDKRWGLIEVKSSTDVKDHHVGDVAIQNRVVTRSGVDLAASCLAQLNRDYNYQGGDIGVRNFLRIRNLTRRIEKMQPKLPSMLRSQFRVLGMSEAPQIASGPQCSRPVTCEFFDRCNPRLPDDHILKLPRIHASEVAELAALGIQPPEFQRTTRQPDVYFADFETVSPAIPALRESVHTVTLHFNGACMCNSSRAKRWSVSNS